LIGRIPVICHLNRLDRNILIRILTEPKNSLVKQYTKIFKTDGVKLTIDTDALNYIVDKALEHKLGARGLRSIFEKVMRDSMYELPSDPTQKTLHITLEFVQEKFKKSNILMLAA